jgi:hypothetical protein
MLENRDFMISMISQYYPFSESLLEQKKDVWDWCELSGNENLPWSADLIDRYKDKWDWNELSDCKNCPWSVELIEKYKEKWLCKGIYPSDMKPYLLKYIAKHRPKGLSKNKSLTWSLELIEKYRDEGNWHYLSKNKSLPWSLELIERYKNKWNWEKLSDNKSLPWSLELIEKYQDKWNWVLCYKYIAHDLDLIEKFADKLEWIKYCASSAKYIRYSLYKDFFELYAEDFVNQVTKQVGILTQTKVDLPAKTNNLLSGFPELDKMTSGWKNSDLIIISGSWVYLPEFISSMLISMSANTNMPVIGILGTNHLSRPYNPTTLSEWKRNSALFHLPVFMFLPYSDVSFLKFREKTIQLLSENDIKYIIMERFAYNGSGYLGEEKVTAFFHALKDLAKELNIPIIAADSQFRDLEIRNPNSRVPSIDENIVQAADVVCCILNKKEAAVIKNNHGATGTISVSLCID